MITVNYNDEKVEIAEGTTLEQFLKDRKIEAVNIAAAVDGQMVPKTAYATTALHDGASILVIKAFYGG